MKTHLRHGVTKNAGQWQRGEFMKQIILIVLTLLILEGNAWEESKPDFNLLADSILQAENNDNYGVLTKYKTTTPRQACINTCKHKYADWVRAGIHGDFIDYLGSKYAPVGASNDNGTNKHWPDNVKYWYRQFENQARQNS